MGATQSKVSRTAPARYVARNLPRDPKAVESEFKKAAFTMQGINTARENVYSEPRMFVETRQDDENQNATNTPDHVAPRWVINQYMEMMDNAREDRVIISGNLPASWERDKYEPYSLVHNRIDDEDLGWLLSQENQDKPTDELIDHTKLERESFEDIRAYVERPRQQYRNYKGKLRKAVTDADEFMEARRKQQVHQRERDVLGKIGFTDEEMKAEEQYMQTRSRGVKTLDMLGVSVNEKRRRERKRELSEMEDLLEERRRNAIEAGVYEPSEDEMRKPVEHHEKQYLPWQNHNRVASKAAYRMDFDQDISTHAKMSFWQNRRKHIKRAKDNMYDVPEYAERYDESEDQMKKFMNQAAEVNMSLSRATGSKGFVDPRGQYGSMMDMIRKADTYSDEATVNVKRSKPVEEAIPEQMKYPDSFARQKLMEDQVEEMLEKDGTNAKRRALRKELGLDEEPKKGGGSGGAGSA